MHDEAAIEREHVVVVNHALRAAAQDPLYIRAPLLGPTSKASHQASTRTRHGDVILVVRDQGDGASQRDKGVPALD